MVVNRGVWRVQISSLTALNLLSQLESQTRSDCLDDVKLMCNLPFDDAVVLAKGLSTCAM